MMIKRNPKQASAFHDKSRFKFLLTARRGGKTYLIKEDICREIPKMPPYAEIAYTGPTLMQAREIIWDVLEERFYNLGWSYKSFPSKNRFEFSRGRKCYVLGAEKISRLRGHKLWKAYLDEVAFFGSSLKDCWRVIRPTLADYQGGAILSTTPNGTMTDCHDFYLEILDKPEWSVHTWHTQDNPWIPREEIEAAKREMDEKSFAQEYLATWTSFEGLAYFSFSEELNVIDAMPFDFSEPIIFCSDFNCSPSSLLLAQWQNGKMYFKKEYRFMNSSTEETIMAFCDDFQKHAANVNILIRGDAAGKSRNSATGRSDYSYMEEILTSRGFRFQKQVLSHNPPIVDRVKTMNAYLKNFLGESKIKICKCCKEFIKDLSSQILTGRKPYEGKDGLSGHLNDAAGYAIYYQDRLQKITPVASRIL